jgi:hypothetical protein
MAWHGLQTVQPAADMAGFEAYEDPESVHHKQWITDKIMAMTFPATPLDHIIDELGGPGLWSACWLGPGQASNRRSMPRFKDTFTALPPELSVARKEQITRLPFCTQFARG